MKPVIAGVVLVAVVATLPLVVVYVLRPEQLAPNPEYYTRIPAADEPDADVLEAGRLGEKLLRCKELRAAQLTFLGMPEEGKAYREAFFAKDGMAESLRKLNAHDGTRSVQQVALYAGLDACYDATDELARYPVDLPKLRKDYNDYAAKPLEKMLAQAVQQ